MQPEEKKDWVVLATRHEGGGNGGPFYRPNSCGYTMCIAAAGLYTEAEARSAAAGMDDIIPYHCAAPELRAYLEKWSYLRRSEFDLFNKVRTLEAATPTPLDDTELAELLALHERAGAASWRADVDVNDDCFIYDAADNLVASMPWINSDGSQQDADLIVAMRNALPRLLARVAGAPKWISVDERLPETHKQMAHGWFEQHSSDLVLGIERGEKKAHLYYCDEKGQWKMSGVEFHGHYAQVTHWQPLPAAPTQPVEGSQPRA